MDNDPAGFEWINADDIFRSIYSFVRHSKNKEKNLLFVCNFTPVEREDYRVGVPTRKTLKLVLNSDEEKYGGKGEKRPLTYKPVKKECDVRRIRSHTRFRPMVWQCLSIKMSGSF